MILLAFAPSFLIFTACVKSQAFPPLNVVPNPIVPLPSASIPTSVPSVIPSGTSLPMSQPLLVQVSFNGPRGIAVDRVGNVYVADTGNNLICKVSPAGNAIVLAGNGKWGDQDGQGRAAAFTLPVSIALNSNGDLVVGEYSRKVRLVTPSGIVSTLAGTGMIGSKDGPGLLSTFATPIGAAFDSTGNIYIADTDNHKIRRISPDGVVSTWAGSGSPGFQNGQRNLSSFRSPSGVVVDDLGNVFVTDTWNHRIRKISPSGFVTNFAGSGTPGFQDGENATASFFSPVGIVLDDAGNLYVSDSGNHRIRKISPQGLVSTIAGSGSIGIQDGRGVLAQFFQPQGIAMDTFGNLYVADMSNNRIRKITPSGTVSTVTALSTSASLLELIDDVSDSNRAAIIASVCITLVLLGIVIFFAYKYRSNLPFGLSRWAFFSVDAPPPIPPKDMKMQQDSFFQSPPVILKTKATSPPRVAMIEPVSPLSTTSMIDKELPTSPPMVAMIEPISPLKTTPMIDKAEASLPPKVGIIEPISPFEDIASNVEMSHDTSDTRASDLDV